jgi:DNA-binding SARP family transcriptional activator
VTVEAASGLIEAGRYDDVDRLLRAWARGCNILESEVGALLTEARELCRACRAEREWAEAHREAAAIGTERESDLRLRLMLILERAAREQPEREPVGGRATDPSPRGTAELTVRCLGSLRVFTDGRDLGPLPHRRAKSIFMYLLLHRGRSIRTEQLMDLFWPEAEPAAARGSVHVAVHYLRRYLRSGTNGGDHVLFRRGGYELDPALRLRVDLDEFGDHTVAATGCAQVGDVLGEIRELTAAETLYGGPLFEDDCYEDWTQGPRRTALDAYVEVLETLTRRYFDMGDLRHSVAAARKILDVQPAHEIAHRALMSSYARLGRHHLALRQFRDCEGVLRTHLDVSPAAETLALYERIRARGNGQLPAMKGSLRAWE